MKRSIYLCFALLSAAALSGCATRYKAQPLPFKAPEGYRNVTTVAQIQIGAQAFVDKPQARQAFGFDILGAGMLPVQVVFDNQGGTAVEVDGAQTFLEDQQGNLWPVLSSKIAYDRATKYAQTQKAFKEGAYKGFLGAAAGALLGAAIGIVANEGVAESAGKGAAMGAAVGATLGGAGALGSDDARREIISDLRDKSLNNKPIDPQSLAHGILFFPVEAQSAKRLRLKLLDVETGNAYTVRLDF